MTTEIEAKFLNIDAEVLRDKLLKLGANNTLPETTMMRSIIRDTAGEMQKKNTFVRVRSEGSKTTLTLKKFVSSDIDGAKEVELVVDSYDDTVNLFKELGYVVDSEQETKREVWALDGVEIMIDQWPWLNPLVEIEGKSIEEVKKTATMLGFNWSNAVFGSVNDAYSIEYPHAENAGEVTRLPEMKLDSPLPDILKLQ